MLWTHASHPLPLGDTNGDGDTTGGGDDGRAVFVDSLLFQQVTTDAQGRARVSFKLSDDLTSWHVSADAMTSVPEAGSGFILVPVGLPFFVEATMAPEYLVTDQPIIRLRAYGSGLSEGDPVTFTVTSASLGLPKTTIRGTAFEDVAVPLPKLTLGDHAITIAASSGAGAAALSDRLTRRFTVVESRLVETRTTYAVLTAGAVPDGGPGFTTYVFSDAGRGRYAVGPPGACLVGRTEGRPGVGGRDGARPAHRCVRRRSGYAAAGDVRSRPVPVLRHRAPPVLLDGSRVDASRVALLAGDRFNRDELAGYLLRQLEDTASTREQRVLAYAGLAGLGEPVLAELQAFAADPALTIRERLYVGLGLAALGDGATALAIERDLLSTYGERRGPWIRLRVGESLDDTVEATSLLALLAAELGDPLANDAEGYVDANPAVDELHSLQQVAFITRMLERTPSAARAVRLHDRREADGRRPRSGRELLASPGRVPAPDAQPGAAGWSGRPCDLMAGADAAGVRGRVMRTSNLPERTRRSPTVPGDAMVEVRLTATFGPQVVAGCHEVSDLAPSGLAPMEYYQNWPADEASASSFVAPYRIDGQRVSFCVGPSKESRTVKMRYFARIVTSGTYTWESAVIQSAMAADSINLTTSRELTIR